jgi:site-specific recombinase XerD
LADDWLGSSGLSANSVQAYRTALVDLVEHFERLGLQPADVRYKQAREWMTSLQKRNYAGITINCYLSAARGLWRELLAIEIAEFNPFREMKNAPYERPLPEPLSEEQVKALIRGEPDLMLHALWEFFYRTGFRCTVTAQLRREQVDFANKCVRVRNKRNRDQVQPLRESTLLLLRAWFDASVSEWAWPGKVWCGKSRHIQPDTIREKLRDAAKRIGLTRDVRPHQLRHSIATHMHDNGADIREVQEFLDHTCIGTTQIYTRISKRRLRNIIDKTHPDFS